MGSNFACPVTGRFLMRTELLQMLGRPRPKATLKNSDICTEKTSVPIFRRAVVVENYVNPRLLLLSELSRLE
jgi:hypothetical protein